MSIHIAINHVTEYRFDRTVSVEPHVFRLRPAPHCRTPILSYSLKIDPPNHFINWQQDPFGNYLARVVFPEKTRNLKIEVDLVAESVAINPFDFFLEEDATKYPFRYEPQLARDLAPYLDIREDGLLLRSWLAEVDRSEQPVIDLLVDINQRLQRDISYLVRMEVGVQTCEQTLDTGSGSCRDSGWLLVQILRHLGLAARFVSGYLVQLTQDEKSLDGPSGPEQDFTDLHAWAEVFLPGAGWVGLDPTSGLLAGEGHIPLACTPDYRSAAPVEGATDPCEVEFYFHNQVERIHEDPRVTKPYSEDQWQSIDALGEMVERQLKSNDVRLTMGGEPTFVSIDDMESAQWNTAALGENKLKLANDLLLRLRDRFAANGLVHCGLGKWYPGEALPRWALTLFWRTDGEAIWQDHDLLAGDRNDQFNSEQAREFIQNLTTNLNLDAESIVPAFEDTYYYLWREGKLPINVDPSDSRLEDPQERARLRRLFEQGLEKPVGYVLPIAHNDIRPGKWLSSAWPLRRTRLYLIPGDSPMGLRLPLEALPWERPEDKEALHDRDPFEQLSPLPPLINLTPAKRTVGPAVAATATTNRRTIHTALCVEPRAGRLHVFMPPLTHLEHYLELVAAVEATASALKFPVVIEGYEPPRDPRVNMLQVTPDPGVIEVNIHPAGSWRELVNNTVTLYGEARQARLGTEKFMLDGRHTGTGGGNHVTIGGTTPTDSPMLRRPDLLRSLVSYWQHHPSLSYLFSGLFIGPTSQAPRVDEARDDALHELELAFARISAGEASSAPWLVDRLLRHLLVDLTGNTHRAEFCIDKLYSPDTANGRRGLVEFRAFEMPPHARMSLVQMLLLRALIAWFWKQPYQQRLVRWGTELHDRFMLPHFVWDDFQLVIEDLNLAGYGFELEWFAPFYEFRFPYYGSIATRGMELHVRGALEPWHVLAEEATGEGTARFVDSSVERLQVLVSGLLPDRYAVTCNGQRVPLHNTGTRGEYVAGVRFKAWQPPSGLHPTIPAHSPLVFDLVDIANGRALIGCTYHVSHPGGRSYDTFPVNAREAEARRIARFWPQGHSSGHQRIPPMDLHPDQPHTLDLRRYLEK
jgi:uncharacterized protein (DUF2126 family)/transglutaminase-like putative cysteine protease